MKMQKVHIAHNIKISTKNLAVYARFFSYALGALLLKYGLIGF